MSILSMNGIIVNYILVFGHLCTALSLEKGFKRCYIRCQRLFNYIVGINEENLENLPAIIAKTDNPLEKVLYIGKKILKNFHVEGQISRE